MAVQQLAEAGLPVVCIETRHAKAFFEGAGEQDRSQRCPRHRPDDAGKSVSTRSREDFDEPETARIAGARKLLQEKAIAIENDIRGLLRNFGLKVGIVRTIGFEARIRELIDGAPELGEIISPLLAARLRAEFAKLHQKVLDEVRDDGTCRRLMTIPSIRPVTSLAFVSTIDVQLRFKNSRAVGPALGLTPVLDPVQAIVSDVSPYVAMALDACPSLRAAQVMLSR